MIRQCRKPGWFAKTNPRRRQNLGLLFGSLTGGIALLLLSLPGNAVFHAPGPFNTGHADLLCEDCHQKSDGSLRQKIQANLQYFLGNRNNGVTLGRVPVASDHCLQCHERPNDRHPVFRFYEPRFNKARQSIAPHKCVSCHREHNSRRVTVHLRFCQECHKKLTLKKDPLKIPHKTLITKKRWDTCLGCHDFHGNHRMKTANSFDDIIKPSRIQNYFDGAKSPYSSEKFYKAKQKLDHEQRS